jgi:hypothetical protein
MATLQEMISRLDRVIASRKSNGEKREMRVEEARPIIEDMVSERLISDDAVCRRMLVVQTGCFSSCMQTTTGCLGSKHKLDVFSMLQPCRGKPTIAAKSTFCFRIRRG